jgi:homoaconitase
LVSWIRANDEAGNKYGIPELAEAWKERGISWLVVAEDNYGEGHSPRGSQM